MEHLIKFNSNHCHSPHLYQESSTFLVIQFAEGTKKII